MSPTFNQMHTLQRNVYTREVIHAHIWKTPFPGTAEQRLAEYRS